MSDELYLVFTMDCERIARFSPPGGPQDWNISERAIRGFAETLLENNLIGTFFIVPETAQRHRELFLELEKEGLISMERGRGTYVTLHNVKMHKVSPDVHPESRLSICISILSESLLPVFTTNLALFDGVLAI